MSQMKITHEMIELAARAMHSVSHIEDYSDLSIFQKTDFLTLASAGLHAIAGTENPFEKRINQQRVAYEDGLKNKAGTCPILDNPYGEELDLATWFHPLAQCWFDGWCDAQLMSKCSVPLADK